MRTIILLVIVLITIVSCDSVVFKEPLPTYGGKNLAEFPEEMRGMYVDIKKPSDSLLVSKTVFIYKYKPNDSSKYKSVTGSLNIDAYAKNYKYNLFVSLKSKTEDYYYVRKVFKLGGNLHLQIASGKKEADLIIKQLVSDQFYDESSMVRILKPTNKELDQLIVNNIFVPNKIFKPINKPIKKTVVASKKGCISGNCIDGYGYYRYDNGYYKGFFKDKNRNGYGYYSWNDGQFYFGDWKNGERSGYGEHFYSNTSFYMGEWKNNMINGYGYKKDKAGKFTRAIWQKGLAAFKFGFEFNNVNKGCAYGDCEDGYGRYFFENGHYYTGFFRNNKPFLGEYNFTGGKFYRGEFTDDYKFSGSGYFHWKNKSYYRGEFENGHRQGLGFYRNGENKSEMKGEWFSGKLVTSFE